MMDDDSWRSVSARLLERLQRDPAAFVAWVWITGQDEAVVQSPGLARLAAMIARREAADEGCGADG